MQNVIAAIFEIESEGYQALNVLSKSPVTESATILQMALIKKEGQGVTLCDSFDSGVHTQDDTLIGGLVGGLLGIMGGPIGMLLMGSYGALAGSLLDAEDAIEDASLMEAVTEKLQDGTTAIVALADESDESDIDDRLSGFKVEILRFDAAVISAQVEEAQKMQREMERQTRERMRATKKEEFHKDLKEKRLKISAEFNAFKEKFKNA
ncbi:MAG: DUF1269 domain-containing protein [Lachnospiraceae bacterium]|nr:DUF1269 domain-containing protein [Lachnospiraceae bacterium]